MTDHETSTPDADVRTEAAEAAAAWAAEAHAARVAAWRRRQAWKAQARAEHAERRRHGLAARHARKLGGAG